MYAQLYLAGVLYLTSFTQAYDQVLGFDNAPEVEQRCIDEIYQAALAEGGIVTCWHGGDAPDQQNGLKTAFEKRFPGMTLNLTVDLSKYHTPRLDRQLALNDVYVDSIIVQTLHDYPRWRDEGALLSYKPLGFEMIRPEFRDSTGTFYGVVLYIWALIWNTHKSQSVITGFEDFLKPEYKDKLVLTYPNDDDAILHHFDLILQEFGISWFEDLLKQNPTWVRGTAAPATIIGQANSTGVATFTSSIGLNAFEPYNISYPIRGQYTSWAQGAGILKDAPHPEGAKLLHAFYLSSEYQEHSVGGTVRSDITVPNQPFDVSNATNTDPTAFQRFMVDRARVERLRNFFEDRLGTAQGVSPLDVAQ